jgi:xanthine dehydrogenase accessory factor
MPAWLDALAALQRDGTPSVLVTVLAARGSTPREAGCKMVVTAGDAHGTIGGGNLEFQSLARARALLAGSPGAPLVAEFPLGPALGQCCGGHASVLFEPMLPPSWQVALFGAGHVGRALVGVLGTLDCRVTWIDPRADAFPAQLPANTVAALRPQPAACVATLPAGASVLVMTHDHALDFEIVAAALPRMDLPFVGLIGSETKRARFVSRLARLGLDATAIRRLTCPVGAPGTGGKAPPEIAIAVAAQLLQIRDAAAAAAPSPRVVPLAGCSGCLKENCAVAEEMAR